MRIFILIAICLLLVGCESAPLKNGALYLNKNASVTMDGFGVAKMRNQF